MVTGTGDTYVPLMTAVRYPRRIGTTELLGGVAMVMAPVQQVLVFAFLFIQPDRPLSDADSFYALGHLGWVWRAGAIFTGLGITALGLGLRRSLLPGTRVRPAVALMLLGGLAVAGTGVFPTDTPQEDGTVGNTTSGVLHFVFGLAGILSLLVVVFFLKGVFGRDPRWVEAARPTTWLAWWLLTGVVLLFALPEQSTAAGLAQRVIFIPEAVWVAWLGWRVADLARAEAAHNPS